MKTFYPQSALEGFTRAIGSQLGVNIDVATDDRASTDGKTVFLPRITKPLHGAEFLALCGVAVHEVAHVFYDSVRRANDFGGTGRGHMLRFACYIAAVDVADETRIEGVVDSARMLLATSNIKAERDILDTNELYDGDPVWACLAAGILWNRLGAGKSYKRCKGAEHRHPNFPIMFKAYKLLQGLKHRRGSNPGARTPAQWAKLAQVADKLVELLRPLGDASGAPCNQGQGNPAGPVGIITAGMGQGSGKPDSGDVLADASVGEQMAKSGNVATQAIQVALDATGQDPSAQAVATAAGAGPTEEPPEPVTMNMGLYTAIKPALVGAVERMARCDMADGREEGHYSGSGIGRNLERAMIDGACFSRRNAEGEKIHAVVLLDASGSMAPRNSGAINEVSAVAQAFADALGHVSDTCELATFQSGMCRSVKNFRNVDAAGCTPTAEALEHAGKILADKSGRRVVIVLTDGDPDCINATINQCGQLRSHGIQIVAIAYGCDRRCIDSTMIGARVVAAKDPNSLTCQLSIIAGQIAGC